MEQQQEQIHLQDYIQIILKRMWTVITFFVIVVTVVTIGTFKQRPVYRATAQILIEKEYNTLPYNEAISVDISQQDYYQSQYKIMKSRTLARKVADELNLSGNEEFSGSKDIVTTLLKHVIVEPVRGSRLVNLSVESYSPQLATIIANKLVETYVLQNLENKLYASKEILKKLPGDSFTGYEESVQSLPSVVSNTLIKELKASYARLETEYADLSKRYKDNHPRMIGLKAGLKQSKEKIAQETRNVVESIKTELSGSLKSNNVRIIDYAEVPDNPVRPKKRNNIILAVVFGLFMGSGLAFFFEYMDNTIKTDKDVEQYLGLAFLGFIPKIRIKDKKEQFKKNMFVITQPKSPATESVKSIRSNIVFSAPKEKLKNIIVTSAGPGDGKTFSSVNIAITFAQAGEETLLVDCDLRRSSVHKVIGIENKNGISNYLIGNCEINSIIQKTDVEHLNIITAGPHPPNPAELLGQAKIKELSEKLRGRYDRIIFDTPPLLPVSDTLNLSSIADGIIMVVSSGRVARQVLLRGKQILQDINAKIIGVVLNNVDIETRGKYYYYPYQYYYYYGSDKKK